MLGVLFPQVLVSSGQVLEGLRYACDDLLTELLVLGGAEGYEASETATAPPSEEPIDLTSLPTRRTWLMLVRHQALDAIAAGEDAARRPSKRVLSRAEVNRKIEIGLRNFERLIDAAEKAIPEGTPYEGPGPDADPPSER